MRQIAQLVDAAAPDIVQRCTDLVRLNTVNPYSGDAAPGVAMPAPPVRRPASAWRTSAPKYAIAAGAALAMLYLGRAPIDRALERGERHATSFYAEVKVRPIPQPQVESVGDPDLLFLNVNSPEDHQRAEAAARERGVGQP